MEEVKERGSGAAKKDWEPRLIEAKYLGHDRYHCRRHCLWKTWTSITRSRALGSDRLARSERNAVGFSQTGVAVPEVNIEAHPDAAEAE